MAGLNGSDNDYATDGWGGANNVYGAFLLLVAAINKR